MPETDWNSLNTRVDFLDWTSPAPLFISCMTGGAIGALSFNRELALAAAQLGLAIGTGSIRVLLHHPEYLDDFRLKQWAPAVPLLANIGAVVIRDEDSTRIIELVKQIGADALVIHLNPGQELFQADGDRDFRGVRTALAAFINTAPFPVIVKETGFGIAPDEVDFLLSAGAAYVDIAGSGGANWIRVEAYRSGNSAIAPEFDHWGYRSSELLEQLSDYPGKILASGGLRNGTDCAKALALGATLCGMATPLARAVSLGGHEAVVEHLENTIQSLKSIMLLTGSATIQDLRRPGVLVKKNRC